MARLYYRFDVEEIKESPNDYVTFSQNLPHESEIKKFIMDTWNDCKQSIISTMPDNIRPNIYDMVLQFPKQADGKLYGIILITPAPGFRWSERRREAVWAALDAQMSDGFGECIDHHIIHEDTTSNTSFMLSL